jgi:hypothetical protein
MANMVHLQCKMKIQLVFVVKKSFTQTSFKPKLTLLLKQHHLDAQNYKVVFVYTVNLFVFILIDIRDGAVFTLCSVLHPP